MHGPRSETYTHCQISDRNEIPLRLHKPQWFFTRGDNWNGPSIPITRKTVLVFPQKDSKYFFQNCSTSVNRSLTWKILHDSKSIYNNWNKFHICRVKVLNLLLLKQSNQMQALSSTIIKASRWFWIYKQIIKKWGVQ